MSLFQRAARLAALTLTLAGVLGSSTVGHATEVERSLAPSGVVTILNAPAMPTVPQPDAAVLADTGTIAAPKARYASLADAVAAQGVGGDDEHLRCLAGAIYYESKGEPLAGQLAVAQVILNRTRSGRFPTDVCGVVKQRGQFSFVRGGAIPAVDGGKLAWRTAMAVAKVALAEAWDAPARDALYFNATRSGHSGGVRIAAIGGHTFYR